MRFVPLLSTAIGIAALCFQVFVLYPWHQEISNQIMTLQSRAGE